MGTACRIIVVGLSAIDALSFTLSHGRISSKTKTYHVMRSKPMKRQNYPMVRGDIKEAIITLLFPRNKNILIFLNFCFLFLHEFTATRVGEGHVF